MITISFFVSRPKTGFVKILKMDIAAELFAKQHDVNYFKEAMKKLERMSVLREPKFSDVGARYRLAQSDEGIE
jgi:hypothetical protein